MTTKDRFKSVKTQRKSEKNEGREGTISVYKSLFHFIKFHGEPDLSV